MAQPYPKQMKLRAVSLRKQGLTIREVAEQLRVEFSDYAERLQATQDGGIAMVSKWLYSPKHAKLRALNKNDIDPNEDLGIVEHFDLIPKTITSDKFNKLTQSIPELLAEKREELKKIEKQVRQLEVMSKALDEELEEDQQPVDATG